MPYLKALVSAITVTVWLFNLSIGAANDFHFSKSSAKIITVAYNVIHERILSEWTFIFQLI